MNRPVADNEAPVDEPLGSAPFAAMDTRTVEPVWRSWRKTSVAAFESLGTRLVESDWKATNRPSAEIAGLDEGRFPSVPLESTETRVVTPVWRSWTNTSQVPLVSPGTRFDAKDPKATYRPSADIAAPVEKLLP